MKKTTPPARSDIVVLKQLLKYIPRSLIGQVARETGAEAKARDFCVFSHLWAMLFAQLTDALGLNDVCDWLRLKQRALAGVGAVRPSRNGLSHANKVRPAEFAEKLFWKVLAHLQSVQPSFGAGRKGRGLLGRFRVRVHAVDSTVRSALWERVNLLALLKSYGTAGGSFRVLGALQQAWLPGFARAGT